LAKSRLQLPCSVAGRLSTLDRESRHPQVGGGAEAQRDPASVPRKSVPAVWILYVLDEPSLVCINARQPFACLALKPVRDLGNSGIVGSTRQKKRKRSARLIPSCILARGAGPRGGEIVRAGTCTKYLKQRKIRTTAEKEYLYTGAPYCHSPPARCATLHQC